MKVLFLIPIFPNPVQTYILNQIVFLKKYGIPFTIIAGAKGDIELYPPEIYDFRLLEDVKYLNLDGIARFSRELITGLWLPHVSVKFVTTHSNDWRRYGTQYFLKEVIRAKMIPRDITIIHSHSVINTYQYLFLKGNSNLPLITTFHGLVPRSANPLEHSKLERVFSETDIFLVNTNFAKSQLTELGCQRDKIIILPQGTDTDRLKYIERSFYGSPRVILLTVARLSIEKGINYAIDAFSKLVKDYPFLEYRIVGDGPERTHLAGQIGRLRLESKVKLLGPMKVNELMREYEQSHIFVLPSIDTGDGYHVETQGVVLQEAQATGLPVIATNTGGIPECIRDGMTGFLVEQKNPVDLAEKIRYLIENPYKWEELSLAGRKDVEERFSSGKICVKLLDIYRHKNSKKF